jgi:hypothetical protein
MKTVTRRIAKLEDQFGTAQRETPVLLAMSAAASELALDQDRCMEILRECGHLPTGPGFGIVYLYEIPDGLNTQELEKYLREHGAAICNTHDTQGRRQTERNNP